MQCSSCEGFSEGLCQSELWLQEALPHWTPGHAITAILDMNPQIISPPHQAFASPFYFILILWFLNFVCVWGWDGKQKLFENQTKVMDLLPRKFTYTYHCISNFRSFTDQRSTHRTSYSKCWLFDFTLTFNLIIQ